MSQRGKKVWSHETHQTWQIDGAEQINLYNGSQVSWMNIGDEASGAHLKALVQDHRTVASMDLAAILQGINECFERWGLPKKIKVDNGPPLVNPKALNLPTKAKLWWIGLGIKVIQNKPRRPQQNGIVECLQGTMKRWSNPKGQNSILELQQRLDEESDFQRNHFRITSKGNKTRKELYPELESKERKYDPDNFDIQLVYNYLSEQVWERRIKNNGEVKFYGQAIYIGKSFARFEVTISFDPQGLKWIIRKRNGTILKTSTKAVPTEKQLKNFVFMSKN